MFTFSVLDQKTSFWVNLVKKNQNCKFKMEFGSKTNLNRQNSMMMFPFSAFDHKISFLGKFGPKIQNCLFTLKFDTKTNLNM